MINLGDLLKLSDKKSYVVASKANKDDKEYYYLVDIDNPKLSMVCYLKDGSLVVVEDKNECKEVIVQLAENAKKTAIQFGLMNNSN